MSRIVVITNPASGRGRGARALPRVRAAFAAVGVTDVRTTASAGGEARAVHAALDDGATTIAVAGGDGTWGRCAAALVESGADASMAFLSGGTGNDFAKNLPAPSHDYEAMARLITGRHAEWRSDMGCITHAGGRDLFLNVAGFGFDVAVLERSLRGGRLRGSAVYIAAAVRELFAYPGFALRRDGAPPREAMMLVISNGLNFGGAFRIAPEARVDDGLLDIVEIGDVHGLARVPLFARALRGAHLTDPRVVGDRAAACELAFDAPPAYEIDGEICSATSSVVRASCLPRALRIVAGPLAEGPVPAGAVDSARRAARP